MKKDLWGGRISSCSRRGISVMSQSKADYINVIGAGLAGSEAAYQIAKRGIPVKLL